MKKSEMKEVLNGWLKAFKEHDNFTHEYIYRKDGGYSFVVTKH